MRWVFSVLFFINCLLLVWRFGIGLPDKYLAPQRSAPPSVPSHIKSVLLLGEQADIQQADLHPDVEQREMCSLVGPFSGSDEAGVFLERLAVLDVNASLQTLGASTSETYWVYLDGLGNRQEAKKVLAKLQAKGIDSYIVPKGEMENSISLGVFSELTLAQARMADLISRDLNAKLKSVTRSVDEYWVRLTRTEVQKVSEKLWSQLLTEQFHLQEKQNFCLDVASQ